MATPVSVVIIAKNEEKRIKDCLESVYGWADEIIVVDDNSTDQTQTIAVKYTQKIFQRRMELEGRQRNFGASKAQNDWIMLLDCDEQITVELKKDIENIVSKPEDKIAAYWALQTNYLGDIPLKHGGWSSPHIRLYNRKYVQWSEAPHDVIHPGLKVAPGYQRGNLNSSTLHYSFRNIEDFISKINRYSTLEATKWYLDGRKMTTGRGVWRCVDRFFRRFIGKKGYKDGFAGLAAAMISAFHEFAAYSKYREMKEKGYYLDRIEKKES